MLRIVSETIAASLSMTNSNPSMLINFTVSLIFVVVFPLFLSTAAWFLNSQGPSQLLVDPKLLWAQFQRKPIMNYDVYIILLLAH